MQRHPKLHLAPAAEDVSSVKEQKTDYPKRQIDLIVPYSAGGDTDLAARAIADYLSKEWDQPIVVINQSGCSCNSQGV